MTSVAVLLGEWIVYYAIHSSILLGGAWALTHRLVRHPEVAEVIWKAAVVCALASSVVQVGLTTVAPSGDFAGWNAEPPHHVQAPISGVASAEAGAKASALRHARMSWTNLRFTVAADAWVWLVIAGTWVLGACVGVSTLLRSRLQLGRIVAAAEPLHNPDVSDTVEELRARLSLRRPIGVMTVSGAVSPAAVGSSTVLLPRDLWEGLAAKHRRAILAHEMAHLRRRDPEWMTGMELVRAVCFFQPLNTLAARRLRDYSELLCDDAAVAHTGRGHALAESLLTLAERLQVAAVSMSVPEFAARSSPLARRVERLIHRPRERRGRPRLAGAAVICTAALLAPLTPGLEAIRRPISAAPVASELPAPQISKEMEPGEWNTWIINRHTSAETPSYVVSFGAMGKHQWRSYDPTEDRSAPVHMMLSEREVGQAGITRTVELWPSGEIRYSVAGHPASFDADARRWLAARLRVLKN